jgi:probable F420-dependent oxidoreductase
VNPEDAVAAASGSGGAVRVGVGPAGIPAVAKPGDGRRFLDFACRVEELGYAALCVGDHLDRRGAPLSLLAVAAGVTQRLTLATHVLCNEFRNPAVLAHEARTIQLLSEGRLELGLGTGWLEKDFEIAGLVQRPFGERLERLAETVSVVRSLGELAPPVVVGGGGPRMLTAAGVLADIVTLNVPLGKPKSIGQVGLGAGVLSAFEQRLAIVRGARSDRDGPVTLHVFVHDVHLGPQWHDQAAAAAQAAGLGLVDYLASPHVLAGDDDLVVARLLELRTRYGIGYVSIPGTVLELFAPILSRLR